MHKGKCDSPSYTFKSKAEAEKAGGALGLSGSHTHTNEKGETLYMPGKNHEEFEKAQKDGKGMKSKFQACLLYTSPSPRDMRRSRMPSSA